MSKNAPQLMKYRNIVSRIRVEHHAYASILGEIEFAYASIGHTATPSCQLVTGESRTGKSSVAKDLLCSHKAAREGSQNIQGIVYAVTPEKATVKSLVESLLRGLGDPQWNRGSVSSQTQRLYKLLDQVRCKMIVLDEFQHLCDKGQKRKLAETADWLKVLLEPNKYGLLAIGLPESASVINRHPQLVQRFDGELRMPLFDWRDQESAKQFRGILCKFQKELAPFEFPRFETIEMGLRMFLATTGRVGVLAKLLDRAVRNAILKGVTEIPLDDLAEAYAHAVWKADQFPVKGGPFGAALEGLRSPVVREVALENAASELVADLSAKVEVFGDRRASDAVSRGASNGSCTRSKSRKRARVKRELGKAL